MLKIPELKPGTAHGSIVTEGGKRFMRIEPGYEHARELAEAICTAVNDYAARGDALVDYDRLTDALYDKIESLQFERDGLKLLTKAWERTRKKHQDLP